MVSIFFLVYDAISAFILGCPVPQLLVMHLCYFDRDTIAAAQFIVLFVSSYYYLNET